MKKLLSFILLLSVVIFCSCDASDRFEKALTQIEAVCSKLGGDISVYTSEDTTVSDTITSLYGTAGTPPDELALIDFGVVWYNKSLTGGDGAIFYVTNLADTASVEKMCRRRQKTVKRTAGIDMTVFTGGHYVCLYTDGLPPLENAIKSITCK